MLLLPFQMSIPECGVVGDSGLPGQQPDGQVDEAQLPVVGVCRGLLVGGGAYYCCQTG